MKAFVKFILKLFLAVVAIALLIGGISYAVVGIDFCLEGVYGPRQALGHFVICVMYVCLSYVVYSAINSRSVDETAELFINK